MEFWHVSLVDSDTCYCQLSKNLTGAGFLGFSAKEHKQDANIADLWVVRSTCYVLETRFGMGKWYCNIIRDYVLIACLDKVVVWITYPTYCWDSYMLSHILFCDSLLDLQQKRSTNIKFQSLIYVQTVMNAPLEVIVMCFKRIWMVQSKDEYS